MIRSARLPVAGLASLLAAAACGSSGGSAVASPSAQAPVETAAASTPGATPAAGPDKMTVSSPDFTEGGQIPEKFTCKGGGERPTLTWSGAPATTTSMAVEVSDPDAPREFVHWLVYGLPGGPHGTVSGGPLPAEAHEADNSGGKSGWTAPCPPSGTHHYHFTIYAERGVVTGGPTADVQIQVRKYSVARATLIGLVSAK